MLWERKNLNLNLNFLKSYSSDDGELILFDNDYFVIIADELTWLLLLKKCLIDCELRNLKYKSNFVSSPTDEEWWV